MNLTFVRIKKGQFAVYDGGVFCGIAADLAAGLWAFVCESPSGKIAIGIGKGRNETIENTRAAAKAGCRNN